MSSSAGELAERNSLRGATVLANPFASTVRLNAVWQGKGAPFLTSRTFRVYGMYGRTNCLTLFDGIEQSFSSNEVFSTELYHIVPDPLLSFVGDWTFEGPFRLPCLQYLHQVSVLHSGPVVLSFSRRFTHPFCMHFTCQLLSL